MRLSINNRAHLRSLTEHLQRAECDVLELDDSTLEVALPQAGSPDVARLELDLYLQVWRVTHPEVTVDVEE
jgi:hypothetical protein